MRLATPFSNKQVNESGEVLASATDDNSDKGFWWKLGQALLAIAVVDSWRGSHVYPLRQVTAMLHKTAKRFDASVTVSRRLKRMEAIIEKLQRQPKMQLTTMQDVGGCRAIVDTLEHANALAEWYKTSALEQKEFEYFSNPKYDYIAHPKPDGYRSIHVIARSKVNESTIQSRRIEIQIRTRLQHQWATAVETVDFFTKQKIKSGDGNPEWRRFFALTGSMFAGKERCPLIPNTPGTLREIVDECFDLWHELNVLQLLRSWSAAMKLIENPESEAFPPNSMCLVELDVRAKTTNIYSFRSDQLDEAKTNYAAKEKEIGADPMRSVVLVSADSMAELRAAYPSYYGDTEGFLEAVAFLLSIKQKPLL